MAHKGYTLNYFIEFFKNIPDHRFTTGTLVNEGTVQRCALGHAGNYDEDGLVNAADREAALERLLLDRTVRINDNELRLGKTPRGRILKALRIRKSKGEVGLKKALGLKTDDSE